MAQNLPRSRFNRTTLLFFVAVLMAGSLIFNTARVVQDNYTLQQKVDRLEEEVAILELENQNLAFNIAYYKTDEFLELEARDHFNKKAGGEQVVYLPKESTTELITTPQADDQRSATDQPEYQKNLEQWLDFLFRRGS